MEARELCAGFYAREEAAWNYAYHYVQIYLKKKLFGPNLNHFEDILHDSLVKVMATPQEKIENPDAFKSFLRTTAWNTAQDTGQYEGRRQHDSAQVEGKEDGELRDHPKIGHGPARVEDALELKQVGEILWRAISNLDKKCRERLTLYYKAIERGDPLRAVAEQAGMAYNAFRVAVVRCKDQLLDDKEWQRVVKARKGGRK